MITSDDQIRSLRVCVSAIEDSVSELNDFSEIFDLLLESLGNRDSQSRIDALSRVACDLWRELYPQLKDSVTPLEVFRRETE